MMININIPDDLYLQAAAIAALHHISVDDVISSGFAEHLSATERLKQQAARGDREAFLRVLAKVPDAEPEDYDRI